MSSVTHFVCDNLQSFLSYVAGVDDASIKGAENNEDSQTELDLHANMPAIGKNSYVISRTGRTASVQPYRPDYERFHWFMRHCNMNSLTREQFMCWL